MIQAMYTFKNAKILTRTLGPVLKKHIEEAQMRFRDEERLAKVMWDSIQISMISEAHQKSAYKQLMWAYDEAGMSAPYGSAGASSPEMGLVQDFIKYWITKFVGNSWESIVASVGEGMQEQFMLVQGIFVNMLDPQNSVLPKDLTSQLDNIPSAGWDFVADQAMEALTEMHENPAKRQKKGKWW